MKFFLADDLSGALETGAQLHAAGHRVRVPLSLAAWRVAEDGALTGFSTESRNFPPDNAARVVAAALAHGHSLGGALVFKKIDSTLRGSVGAEIRAIAAALPGESLLIAPANPAAGRTVRDGVLLVRGVPVADTEFARDLANPTRASRVAEVLALDGALTPRLLPLATVREGAAACSAWLAGARGQGTRVFIAETETAADLAAVAAAWMGGILVGSGAWAATTLPRLSVPAVAAVNLPRGATLFLCGSAHPRNRAQAARLVAAGVPLALLPVAVSSAPALAACESALRVGGCAALMAGDDLRDPAAVQAALAAALRAHDARVPLARLFVTGGETACAACAALGGESLLLVGATEPGVALTMLTCAGGRTLSFAAKPGGFGDDESWVRVLRAWA